MEFPVSLTVSIQRDQAETQSRLGSRLGIDNRVGVVLSVACLILLLSLACLTDRYSRPTPA